MNWIRLIYLYLPICLRQTGIYALLQVLVTPITALYNIFEAFKAEEVKEASITPGVFMLKKIIYDKFGVNVEIEEDNGQPNDFKVVVDDGLSDSKRQQIYSFVNKYKMAGKSFYVTDNKFTLGYELVYALEKIKQYSIGLIGYCELRTISLDLDPAIQQNGKVVINNDGLSSLNKDIYCSFDIVGHLYVVVPVLKGNVVEATLVDTNHTKRETVSINLKNSSAPILNILVDEDDDAVLEELEETYGQIMQEYYVISDIDWSTKRITTPIPEGCEINITSTETRQYYPE